MSDNRNRWPMSLSKAPDKVFWAQKGGFVEVETKDGELLISEERDVPAQFALDIGGGMIHQYYKDKKKEIPGTALVRRGKRRKNGQHS